MPSGTLTTDASGAFGTAMSGDGSRPFAASEPSVTAGGRNHGGGGTSSRTSSVMDAAGSTARSSHRHSSIRDSTVSFLRNVFANRQADYHDDAPARAFHASNPHMGILPGDRRTQLHWAESGATHQSNVGSSFLVPPRNVAGNNDGNNPGGGGGGGGRDARPPSLWSKLRNPSDRRSLFLRILNSSYWKFALIVFALILLFGAQVRDLFIPRAGDNAVNAIFCIVFVFFAGDIGMRVDAEDHYFSCHCAGIAACCERNNNNNRRSNDHNKRNQGCCRMGSFLFWCDFLSTLTLLADISWINTEEYREKQYRITLNPFGIPVSGLEDLNPGRPVQFDVALLVTISQTARVARFIRSSRAVKLSGRINWYFIFNLFNPSWWWGHLRRRRRRRSSDAKAAIFASAELSGAGENSVHTGGESRRGLQPSWSTLGVGALAAVKAHAAMEERSGLHRLAAHVMGMFGRTYFSKEDFRRHYAAVRIQRAWRATLEQRQQQAQAADETFSSEFLGADVAWKGRMSTRGGAGGVNLPVSKKQPVSKIQETPAKKSGAVTDNPISTGAKKRRNESQVGSAMRELTGQRVAIGIIIALFLTVIFTYTEEDTTRPATMVVLMNQTGNAAFANRSITAARSSSIPDLFSYTMANGVNHEFDVVESGVGPDGLRPSERIKISVSDAYNRTTVGLFNYRNERRDEAWVKLISTVFILLVWFFGVTAFAGPVMVLVVIPIERMVRLLAMLMIDPLGYQGTGRYKRFVDEENEITKNTRWTPEILKGMETSFLMSTILRIGSLMKVGFGSAGVEIIRNNLEKGQSKNTLILSSQGSTVSCIFLFCDIRNFTDATECLQEEVFVFTNRIAAVVHSNCHSLGGSANKNIGDAFLLSWLLDEDNSLAGGSGHDSFSTHRGGTSAFTAKNNQADKALLTVVRVCMALHFDDYYLEAMTTGARDALVAKLKKRKGPIVQMGFGLHAGRAVQGAIGSQRKIDATYVSEAVERAEFLESSTKKYNLKMLMSDSFHRLLHPSNRRRCRKIDQILIREDEEEDDEEDDILNGEVMELFTFDMDIVALWNEKNKKETGRESDSASDGGSRRTAMAKMPRARRISARKKVEGIASDEMSENESGYFGQLGVGGANHGTLGVESESGKPSKLVLPTGPALYNANVWTSEDMRTIRQLYSDGLFFQKFMSGLQSFYSKDWEHARQCFAVILERFEDGPSRYFMNQIEKHNGKPPKDFIGYGTA